MLIYVRHGSVAHPGEPERIRRVTDRLTPEGRKQATKVGKFLRGLRPTTFTTSRLPRAEEFARIIGDIIGIHPTIDPALDTWNTGEFSGHKVADVKDQLMTYIEHPHRSVLGGEALNDAIRRLVPAIKQRVTDPGVHLVIGHGRGITIADGLASSVGGIGVGIDPKALKSKPTVPNGGITTVGPDWTKRILTDHLKG